MQFAWALVLCAFACGAHCKQNYAEETPNFHLRHRLADGQIAQFSHWRRRWGQELRVPDSAPSVAGHLRLMQVSNGRVLVQLVYSTQTHALIDCDIEHNKKRVSMFLHEFSAQTRPVLNHIDLYAANGTHFSYLDVRQARMEPLLQYGHLKQTCKSHHQQKNATMTNVSASNASSPTEGVNRSKRSVLISPGTEWCGAGSNAQHSMHLGVSARTDQCCREHDGCPYVIDALSTRYGYFNYRFYTMSYCDCDRRFYDCLKAANTSTAHMIGKVFFNVVNRSCFGLRRSKMCSKYSWWGVCNRYRTGLEAQLRSLRRF